MTIDHEFDRPRQRAKSAENLYGSRAREIVAPYHQRVRRWQERLAHLRAVKVFRPQEHADSDIAAELVPLVVAARIELEAELAKVELGVADHSAVASVRAALKGLREDLEAF